MPKTGFALPSFPLSRKSAKNSTSSTQSYPSKEKKYLALPTDFAGRSTKPHTQSIEFINDSPGQDG
jgi:hypothetical protein